jgi:zinc transporter, ZIP family
MGLGETLLLGFIAGATILFGLPMGRLRHPVPSLRLFLNAVAIGVLLFLVWDVLSAAWSPVDTALTSVHAGHGGAGRAVGYGLLFAAGLTVGLLALVAYEKWMHRRRARETTGVKARLGPGAMHVGELTANQHPETTALSSAKQLSVLIAVGIGLHNFAEGLAIGQSAARSEIALATLLVIGFGLHNATEGFGIVAPLAAAGGTAETNDHRAGWGFLLALAAIGGGPTFVGTVVGHAFTSEPVAVIFLTLAAGSIIYVIIQLLNVAARSRRADLLAYGLLVGLLLGFGTDAIVSAAGA